MTIVVFSDFECPFCSKGARRLEEITQRYGASVRIAFKHNPLPMHANARPAARLAIAAAQQGKFWELHDAIFADQRNLDEAGLEKRAAELGLDVSKLKADAASPATERALAADIALAEKLGARGTPAFFVNGKRLMGAQPFEKFRELIDAELKAAGLPVPAAAACDPSDGDKSDGC